MCDSVCSPFHEATFRPVALSPILACRIVSDEDFRQKLLSAVLKAGLEIEKALGSAQDIEGVIDADGNLTVVQTRPQM